jgi:inner membrane protein YidH
MSDLEDPRVLFAAERTLMAFGFVIERFGLFVRMLAPQAGAGPQSSASFWIGLAFIATGAFSAAGSVLQYRTVLRNVRAGDIPKGYRVNMGAVLNVAVAVLGSLLAAHLYLHGPKF